MHLVHGRALVSLLVETPDAVSAIDEIVRVPGVGEVMIGLNDVQHGYHLSSPFEFVVSDGMRRFAEVVHGGGLPFGFGGLADPAHHRLPVPASLVHAQYPRLGATSAFVARHFSPDGLTPSALSEGLPRCRAELDRWFARSPGELETARQALEQRSVEWRDQFRS